MRPAGLGTKNDCAGEGQQQCTRPTPIPTVPLPPSLMSPLLLSHPFPLFIPPFLSPYPTCFRYPSKGAFVRCSGWIYKKFVQAYPYVSTLHILRKLSTESLFSWVSAAIEDEMRIGHISRPYCAVDHRVAYDSSLLSTEIMDERVTAVLTIIVLHKILACIIEVFPKGR
jgi:hypothetical protein